MVTIEPLFPEDPLGSHSRITILLRSEESCLPYGCSAPSALALFHNKALLDHSGADVYIRISCTVTLPTSGGAMGDCPSSLPSGSSRTPTCDSGYTPLRQQVMQRRHPHRHRCVQRATRAMHPAPSPGDPGSACTSTLAHWSSCTPTCNTGYTSCQGPGRAAPASSPTILIVNPTHALPLSIILTKMGMTAFTTALMTAPVTGTTGSCLCSGCKNGYGGPSCETAGGCSASSDSSKDGE